MPASLRRIVGLRSVSVHLLKLGAFAEALFMIGVGLFPGSLAAQSPGASPAAGTPAPPSANTNSSKMGANVKELQKVDTKQGSGAEAQAGKPVVVHYTGWLYDPAAADGH